MTCYRTVAAPVLRVRTTRTLYTTDQPTVCERANSAGLGMQLYFRLIPYYTILDVYLLTWKHTTICIVYTILCTLNSILYTFTL